MSSLYLIALSGVLIALLAMGVEAVLTVSRKPSWQLPRRTLTLMEPLPATQKQVACVDPQRRENRHPESVGAEPEREIA